jgi:hypothetical protein
MTLHKALHHHLTVTADFMRGFRPDKFPYSGMEEFVLKEGRAMQLTPKDPKVTPGVPKECFKNSTDYALAHRDHLYVEGYVMSPKVPVAIHHAWVLNKAGLVIDPTLGWRKGSAYWGVSFTTDDMLRRILKTKYYGLYCDDIRVSDLVLGLDKEFRYKGLEVA